MEDVKEELVQAAVPVQAAMGPAVTQAPNEIKKEVAVFLRGIANTDEMSDDVVTSCKTLYQRYDVKQMEEILASGVDLKTNRFDQMLWFDGVSLGALRFIAASLTADPGSGTAGGSLEPNLPSLLSQVSVLTEALEKIAELDIQDVEPASDSFRNWSRALLAAGMKMQAIARTALSAQGEKT